MKRTFAEALVAFLLAWALTPVVEAQVNDFGVGGILDIPSARMLEEGTLTTT